MINIGEVIETNEMVEQENLDVRTITLGISLLDCIDPDLSTLKKKIYEKITRAEYPPIKFTPTAFAASSKISAIEAKSSGVLQALPPTRAMGVTAIRLFTMGMANSCSISSPVFAKFFATLVIFS